MLLKHKDWPRLIDKKIIRGFSLPAVHECSRQTAKSTRRKSNRIHQLLNSSHYDRNYGHTLILIQGLGVSPLCVHLLLVVIALPALRGSFLMN